MEVVVNTTHLTDKALRDYKLVQLAVNNCDQKAYAELLNNYKDSIFFMLLKMTNNSDDADDLTIEAFGKAFKKLHQYTPDYAFSTWLFKIASNNCIDFMRRKKKLTFSMNKPFENEDGKEMSHNIADDVLNPEDNFIKKQKVKLMREIVEMRYFQELSYEEIADQLTLPLGTVKAQLFRAREFLYNILKDSQESI